MHIISKLLKYFQKYAQLLVATHMPIWVNLVTCHYCTEQRVFLLNTLGPEVHLHVEHLMQIL